MPFKTRLGNFLNIANFQNSNKVTINRSINFAVENKSDAYNTELPKNIKYSYLKPKNKISEIFSKPLPIINPHSIKPNNISIAAKNLPAYKVNNLSLIDENFIQKFTDNNKPLIIKANNEKFILTPYKTHENSPVYWKFIKNNSSIHISNYKYLETNHQISFTKYKFLEKFNTDKDEISQNIINTNSEINFLQKDLKDIRKQKQNLENLWAGNPIKLSMNDDYKQALSKEKSLHEKIALLKKQVKNLEQDFDSIDYLITQVEVDNEGILKLFKAANNANEEDNNFKVYINDVSIDLDRTKINELKKLQSQIINTTNFSYQDILHIIKQNSPNIKIYNDSLLYKTHFDKIAKVENLIKDNKDNKINLLTSIASLLETTSEELIEKNPSLVKKIAHNKSTDLDNIFMEVNDKTIDKYNLNKIFANKSNVNDHKKRRNGGALLRYIDRVIFDKKTFILKNQSEVICLKYINEQWVEQNITKKTSKIIQIKIEDYLASYANKDKTNLYIHRTQDFTRKEFRCKFRKQVGNKSLTMHDKLERDTADWESKRAREAKLLAYKAIQIRNDTGEHKRTEKADDNALHRAFSSYLNPISKEHWNSWKSCLLMSKALFGGEDRLRRFWNNFKAGMWQPQDTLATLTLLTFADAGIFKDMKTAAAIAGVSGITFDNLIQIVADKGQEITWGSIAKNKAGFGAGLEKTVKEVTKEADILTNTIESKLELLNYLDSSTQQNFILHNKHYNKDQYKMKICKELFKNLNQALKLILEHKSQNKAALSIGVIDQLNQLVARGLWIGLITAFPPLKAFYGFARFDTMIRRVLQTLGAGIDNNINQKYKLRTHVNEPSHLMREQALEYGIDKMVGQLSPKEFDENVIDIMIECHAVNYTKQQIQAMNEDKRNILISGFIFDEQKMQNTVSHNSERRVGKGGITHKYIEKKNASYRLQQMEFEKELERLKSVNPSQNVQDRIYLVQDSLNKSYQQSSGLKQESILYYQGLEYIEAKRDGRYVNPQYKYSWSVLAKNYPNGKLNKLIQTSPWAIFRKNVKMGFDQPNETILHTIFRTRHLPFFIFADTITSCVEDTPHGQEMQRALLSGLLSVTLTSAVVGSIASYVNRMENYGRTANHEIYALIMIKTLEMEQSAIDVKLTKLEANTSLTAQEKARKNIKYQEQSKLINQLKEYLTNDVKPEDGIKRLAEISPNQSDINNITTDILTTSVASLIPRTNNKFNHFTASDDTWIKTATNANRSFKNWYITNSIFALPTEKIRSNFINNTQGAYLDNAKAALKYYAHNPLNNYTPDNEKNDYLEKINYLYKQIPDGIHNTKIDHAVNRRIFVNKMQSILAQVNQELQNLNIYNEDNPQDNNTDKLHLENFTQLKDALESFVASHKDIYVPYTKENIYLDDIHTHLDKITHINVNPKQEIENRDNAVEISLEKTAKWHDIQHYGMAKTRPIHTKPQKVWQVTKQIGIFSVQKFFNLLDDRWIGWDILKHAVIAPYMLYENVKKSSAINRLKGAGQKVLNHKDIQNYVIVLEKKLELANELSTLIKELALATKENQDKQKIQQIKKSLEEINYSLNEIGSSSQEIGSSAAEIDEFISKISQEIQQNKIITMQTFDYQLAKT